MTTKDHELVRLFLGQKAMPLSRSAGLGTKGSEGFNTTGSDLEINNAFRISSKVGQWQTQGLHR